MKYLFKPILTFVLYMALAMFTSVMHPTQAAELNAEIDNFDDASLNAIGIARQFIDDTMVGGKTQTSHTITNGVMQVSGKIVPPRGQPGWASAIQPLDAIGAAQDASRFEGVRLRVRINQGNLNLSVNSTEITNFDFHTAPVVVTNDGEFHEVKVPFASMKRNWSEQIPLDTATINSLSIVAYSLQAAPFDYEIAEVGFY